MKGERDRLKLKNEKMKKYFQKKLFEIFLQVEKNNRENIKFHTRELSYRYANDDDQSIKSLKQEITRLKREKKELEADSDAYFEIKLKSLLKEKNEKIKILKDILLN